MDFTESVNAADLQSTSAGEPVENTAMTEHITVLTDSVNIVYGKNDDKSYVYLHGKVSVIERESCKDL